MRTRLRMFQNILFCPRLRWELFSEDFWFLIFFMSLELLANNFNSEVQILVAYAHLVSADQKAAYGIFLNLHAHKTPHPQAKQQEFLRAL